MIHLQVMLFAFMEINKGDQGRYIPKQTVDALKNYHRIIKKHTHNNHFFYSREVSEFHRVTGLCRSKPPRDSHPLSR